MKQLFVHITDPTTDFLCAIYKDVPNSTVLREDVGTKRINKLISEHDRVVMLGHGSPLGLFSNKAGFIIGDANVKALANKDNVYIWCHASKYVQHHQLKGFATGMFVSECSEARYCGIKNYSQQTVTESNDAFARLVRSQIDKPSVMIHRCVMNQYKPEHMNFCEVVQYNRNLMLLSE